MKIIVWAETAQKDLRSIHAYIARDSRFYAQRMIERIKKKVEQLAAIPMLGGIVEDWGREDIREIPVANYRVIYRLIGDLVLVLTVIHGARQLPDLDRYVDDEETPSP